MVDGMLEGLVATALVGGYKKVFPGQWSKHSKVVRFFATAVAASITAVVPILLSGGTLAVPVLLKTAGTAFVTALAARQGVKHSSAMAAEIKAVPKALVEKISIKTKPPRN